MVERGILAVRLETHFYFKKDNRTIPINAIYRLIQFDNNFSDQSLGSLASLREASHFPGNSL